MSYKLSILVEETPTGFQSNEEVLVYLIKLAWNIKIEYFVKSYPLKYHSALRLHISIPREIVITYALSM